MGNPTNGRELGFLAPTNMDWFVVFEFDSIGFVKDDDKDKLDAEAMLKAIKAGTGKATSGAGKWAPRTPRGRLGAAAKIQPGVQQPGMGSPRRKPGRAIVNYNTRCSVGKVSWK